MTSIRITRTIHADRDRVFRAVDRFIKTRLKRGSPAETTLEITEYIANERVRVVAESHGTVWDTTFTVRPTGDTTELDLVVDVRARKLLPRLLNPLMKGSFRRSINRHLDGLQAYCEGRPRARAG